MIKSVIDFLTTIFEAIKLYSTSSGLGEHLKGMATDCSNYTRPSIYNTVFLSMLIINFVVVWNYYYGLFNKVPWNRTWKWLLNIVAGALIVFGIAFIYSNKDISTQNYCNQLQINKSDCIGFGITAAIYSLLYSVVMSAAMKWGSIANKKIPF
jgi:hypothetical protein